MVKISGRIVAWVLVVLFLMLSTLTPAHALEDFQIKNIKKCYKAGEPYNLGQTMAAICYHESRAGLYKINSKSDDYGLPQIHLKTALSRLNLKSTWHNKQRIRTRLVTNDEFALDLAIQELRYWKETRGRGWKDTVASYNQGTVIQNYDYFDAVLEALRTLKKRKLI